MTAAPPLRDSVLDTIGYASGVLSKPGFLWAPIVLTSILVLPLAFLPGMDGTYPSLATQADVEAYLRSFVPVFAVTTLLGIVLGPLVTAIVFQLGRQYLDGEPPRPFAPGIVELAMKFFLLTVTYLLLAVGGAFVIAVAFVVLQGIAGIGLAFLVCTIVAMVVYFAVAVRLAPATALLLSGAGPVEAIKLSWELTRGQFGRTFRWLFVTVLVVSLAAGVIGALVGVLFVAAGFRPLGQMLGAAIAAPVNLIAAIVLIRLTLLLSNPNQPPPPSPPLPEWMNPPASGDPGGVPSAGGGSAATG